MKNDRLEMTMLLDFYGELLTGKQREYLSLYHNEDFSLAEIAEREGISKQGVHDIIMRAEKMLINIEQKTGIMHKWREVREQLKLAAGKSRYIHPAVADYFWLDEPGAQFAPPVPYMENTDIGI